MNTFIKAEIQARMLLVRAYNKEGWFELSQVQIKLIRKSLLLAKYLQEKELIDKTDKIIYLKAA